MMMLALENHKTGGFSPSCLCQAALMLPHIAELHVPLLTPSIFSQKGNHITVVAVIRNGTANMALALFGQKIRPACMYCSKVPVKPTGLAE